MENRSDSRRFRIRSFHTGSGAAQTQTANPTPTDRDRSRPFVAGARPPQPARPMRRSGCGVSAHARRPSFKPPVSNAAPSAPVTLNIPPVGDNVRIIPLGGVEEIGKNMTAIEIGDDIIVVDAGFQFRDDDTPGVDYILPNTKYLEERQDKIRGVLITHGHL